MVRGTVSRRTAPARLPTLFVGPRAQEATTAADEVGGDELIEGCWRATLTSMSPLLPLTLCKVTASCRVLGPPVASCRTPRRAL